MKQDLIAVMPQAFKSFFVGFSMTKESCVCPVSVLRLLVFVNNKGSVVMSSELLHSTDVCFNTHDNVFIRFLHRHPIRLVRLDQELYFVARDIITSLGYSPASIQHLTRKCPNKRKFEVRGRRGKTRVNIIPIRDVLSLIYKCPLETESVIELQNWIIEQAVATAKDYQMLLQPKDVSFTPDTLLVSREAP